MKNLFPYTHASAMRLWWNLVSLLCITLSENAFRFGAAMLLRAERTGSRADTWDDVVQRMRGKK
jgi:hypothetical protein